MAPVVWAMRKIESLFPYVISTGQHRELLDELEQELGIRPDEDLRIMARDQTLTDVMGKVLSLLPPRLREIKPAAVLVQGDTSTAFAAAAAAFSEKIPVGHVEAGLRTHDKWRPFPEEMNRRLISPLADFHFAPSDRATGNLAREGIETNVFMTGNTIIDTLKFLSNGVRPASNRDLGDFLRLETPYFFVTAHRRENWGEPLETICSAVKNLADRGYNFLWAAHPNPKVRDTVYSALGGHERVRLVEPLDYVDCLKAIRMSVAVLTDSGGIQEEAAAFGKPVFVLRESTERQEIVEEGLAKLVGHRAEIIVSHVESLGAPRLLGNNGGPGRRYLYGDGAAGEKIVDILEKSLAELAGSL